MAMQRIFRLTGTRNMASASSILQNRVNVFGKPLIVHSTNPPTGYLRNGFCDVRLYQLKPRAKLMDNQVTSESVVTDEFLDYSAALGNDLRGAGLDGGCRWCLCVNRWKEAFNAYKSGKVSKDTVPKVSLEATHIRALQGGVTMNQLEEFALDRTEK